MRGKLSDKPFPSVVRALSRENATGRLRLTQSGKIREILIESGIPVFASSTIAEEQIEHKLVQEGLISPEQLDAALLSSRQTSQPVEKILVQTRAITRLGLQRTLCELSTSIINSSSEWVTGDYRFVAASRVPLEAKLIWTSTECILSGARHASANNSVLDAIASDDRTVMPASDQGSLATESATLTSTEGYVLSCLQSPTTIADAGMLTGLSHIDTRRAILVLLLLGLLEVEGSGHKEDATQERPAAAMPAAPQQNPPAVQTAQQVQDPVYSQQTWPRSFLKTVPASTSDSEAIQTAQPDQYPVSHQAASDSLLKAQPPSTDSSAIVSERVQADVVEPAISPSADWESEAWPLEFGANDIAYTTDDSSQIEFNSSDISFVDYPEQSGAPETPDRQSSQLKPHAGKNGVSNDRQRQAVEEIAASAPATAPTPAPAPAPVSVRNAAPAAEPVRQIFIPTRAARSEQEAERAVHSSPATPARERTGSIFIPGQNGPRAQEPEVSAPVSAPPTAPLRENPGSIYIPNSAAPPAEQHSNSAPFAAPATQPLQDLRRSPDGFGEFDAPPPHYAPPPQYTTPPQYTAPIQPEAPTQPPASSALPAPPATDSDSGYGWNGETDPRLHQEWREQTAAPARPDNDDDERFLKRVIEELSAKVCIAASADYYQILGVDKLASNGSITKAYERVSRINDSHKSRWPFNAELQAQISAMMVVVNKAFETLGSPEKRRVYDMPSRQQAPPMEIERGSGVPTGSIGARPNPALPPARVPPPPGGGLGSPTDHRNPYEAAAELYKRGRACFARSDLQAAAHLLRQAVNLDPGRSTYHYQLGMTLFILSQARAEHKHDNGCHVTCKMGGNLTRNQRIRHEAEQHLLKASELEPSNSDIKLKLALLYKDANMDRKAHQYFYEALMLDPNCHIARVELGMENTREKDEDQWIKDLMRDRSKKK